MTEKMLHGVRAFFYEKTDSTNTRAKLFAENEGKVGASPAIFFTRAQSAGRGTRARTFESPEGAGLYVSFLLYPTLSGKDLLSLTTYAAVAVCRAVEKISAHSLSPRIKWVNDITVNDRKLCGILTEGKISPSGECEYAIVGIGINLADGEHSEEVRAVMTTLAECGVKVTPDTLAEVLTEEFFEHLNELGTPGCEAEYISRSSVIGRRLRITSPHGTEYAVATGIGEGCSLICKDESGNEKEYISADVQIRPDDK